MANRDANLIKRTIQDFSLNAGTGSSGTMTVKELPKKGEVGNLYTLPNGDMYSWFHEETTEEVTVYEEMEVGKSYKFRDKVLLSDAAQFFVNLYGGYSFLVKEGSTIDENISVEMECYPKLEEPIVEIRYGLLGAKEPTPTIRYNFGKAPIGATYVEPTLSVYEEIPSMEVTESFVNQFTKITGKHLKDVSFLFELKEDKKIVTTVKEGWMKVSGPTILDSSKIQRGVIFLDDENYDALSLYNTIDKGLDIRYIYNDREEVFYDYLESYKYTEETNSSTGEKIKGVILCFKEGNEVSVVLDTRYMEPTISGKELNDFVAPFNEGFGSTVYWSDLFNNYIYPSLTQEDYGKELADGSVIVSLFDDAVQLKINYAGPDEESSHSELIPIINATSGKIHDYDYVGTSNRDCKTLGLISSEMTIENDSYANYKLHFDESKNYSTPIVIKFGDNTSKTIKAPKDFIKSIIRETMVL